MRACVRVCVCVCVCVRVCVRVCVCVCLPIADAPLLQSCPVATVAVLVLLWIVLLCEVRGHAACLTTWLWPVGCRKLKERYQLKQEAIRAEMQKATSFQEKLKDSNEVARTLMRSMSRQQLEEASQAVASQKLQRSSTVVSHRLLLISKGLKKRKEKETGKALQVPAVWCFGGSR